MVRNPKTVHQKWPKTIFPFANFIFPTMKSGSKGGGGWGPWGGLPPSQGVFFFEQGGINGRY